MGKRLNLELKPQRYGLVTVNQGALGCCLLPGVRIGHHSIHRVLGRKMKILCDMDMRDSDKRDLKEEHRDVWSENLSVFLKGYPNG